MHTVRYGLSSENAEGLWPAARRRAPLWPCARPLSSADL